MKKNAPLKKTVSYSQVPKKLSSKTQVDPQQQQQKQQPLDTVSSTQESVVETTPANVRPSNDFKDSVNIRNAIRVMQGNEDVTPKPVDYANNLEDFSKLQESAAEFLKNYQAGTYGADTIMRRTSLGGAMRVGMDDIVHGISQGLLILYEHATKPTKQSTGLDCLRVADVKISPFIKICLRQTEDILLFEQRSITVPSGTEEATRIERENKAYEYVTKGRGRLRRKADSEAQTTNVLYKSRDVNTDTIKRSDEASYVSNFDMFDTYQQLEQVKSTIKVNEKKSLEVTTYTIEGADPFAIIQKSKEFEFAQMVTERILAGNVFMQQQRRFRNMFMPNPLSDNVQYLYRTEILWNLVPVFEDKERRAVSCMSFCPSNGDILAVGYGIFTCAPNFSVKCGYVCIWSIKNPVNPEKVFEYSASVVSVEFSPFRPQLLAIGLYDGSVQVRDITTDDDCIVAISQRETSPGYEPVTDIKWVGLDPGEETDIEPFLTVSQDGSVMKYRVINSPYLLGYTHAVLDRVEGSPEGLPVERPWNTLEAVRNPQCLGITLDATKQDIFFVLSNEGVIYKCSTNYPQQHLELMQTHEGGVYCMEFSPWSPKLFLTCGDDWCIRIWIEGIFKPLITLTNKLCPVNSAYWSKTHSTIIVANCRASVDVWDLRRSTLKPVSSTKLDSSRLTMSKFSNCGRCIAVGNERGAAYMCALEDMPFPPHFQYDELEASIFKALMSFPELVTELKGVGHFGYSKNKDIAD